MPLIGYARVSTDEQTNENQVRDLKQAGCSVIVEEHASGANRSRPQLARLLNTIKPGDTLVVVRLDRLARSLKHLIEILDWLERRGAGFRSLGDPIDTTTAQGMFVTQILGAVAQFERALIRERTKAGMKTAMSQGRRPGNPGLRFGKPEAIAAVARARDARISDRLALHAQDILPTVRRLRPQMPWDRVAAVLNSAKTTRPSDGKAWTRKSVTAAVRRLVRDGLAEPMLLKSAPKKRTSEDLVRLVAGIARSLPDPTLARIGAQLEAMHERTPRGGARWSRSSVKNLLDRARDQGLLPPEDVRPSEPQSARSVA